MSRARVEQTNYRTLTSWIALLVVAATYSLYLFWSWWHYPPAVEFDNLKYIQLLRTAVSAKRPDWVAKVKATINLRVANGAMSEREHSHFEQVIVLAEKQQWEESHAVCFRFEEAQLSRHRNVPANLKGAH